jgi:AraC-like DNA-binding protein
MPSAVLDFNLPQANPELQQSLIQHANHALHQLQPTTVFIHHATAVLQSLLQQNTHSKAALADALNLSSRTLQRRFQEMGSSYQTLLSDLRFKQAKILLHQGLAIDQISPQLGFAETRSFLRSFKQWSGVTTGQYLRHNLS